MTSSISDEGFDDDEPEIKFSSQNKIPSHREFFVIWGDIISASTTSETTTFKTTDINNKKHLWAKNRRKRVSVRTFFSFSFSFGVFALWPYFGQCRKTCFFFFRPGLESGNNLVANFFGRQDLRWRCRKVLKTLEQIFHRATVELTSESFRGGTSPLFFEPKWSSSFLFRVRIPSFFKV